MRILLGFSSSFCSTLSTCSTTESIRRDSQTIRSSGDGSMTPRIHPSFTSSLVQDRGLRARYPGHALHLSRFEIERYINDHLDWGSRKSSPFISFSKTENGTLNMAKRMIELESEGRHLNMKIASATVADFRAKGFQLVLVEDFDERFPYEVLLVGWGPSLCSTSRHSGRRLQCMPT